LTVVALAATVMALYLQIFERRARQEEARLAAVRLDDALADSRARLRDEILAELRAELSKERDAAGPGTQPVPDTVLRRLETGGSPREALASDGLGEALQSLARQTEESDRALRRELEELRAATLRESDISSRIASLVLVALVSLIAAAFLEQKAA
jgi:hypothetical protein